jgi:hypothetical protein
VRVRIAHAIAASSGTNSASGGVRVRIAYAIAASSGTNSASGGVRVRIAYAIAASSGKKRNGVSRTTAFPYAGPHRSRDCGFLKA